MRKLEINEIKKCSFELLCMIKSVCEENGISYSLTGGTLIGAVRHKGFIPWDDDIDVMMPRPDYDRFISIVSKGDYGFDLFSDETCGEKYGYPFAKASHRSTAIKENAVQSEDFLFGVYVDVFPVDGIGDSYFEAKVRTAFFQFLHGLKVASNWTEYHKSKLREWYYEPLRYICYLASRIIGRKLIDKWINRFLRRKSFETSKYAGRLVGDFGSKEVMNKQLFQTLTQVEFEGEMFEAVSDYDTFLTKLYGDYMTPPPPAKQVSHHEFEAFWID